MHVLKLFYCYVFATVKLQVFVKRFLPLAIILVQHFCDRKTSCSTKIYYAPMRGINGIKLLCLYSLFKLGPYPSTSLFTVSFRLMNTFFILIHYT